MIKIMHTEELDPIFEKLSGTIHAPEGINHSYLWEISRFSFTDIYYSLSKNEVKDVIYKYSVANKNTYEEWTDSKSVIEILNDMKMTNKGQMSISLTNESVGKKLGLKKIDENKEMRLAISKILKNGPFEKLTEDALNSAISLMKKDWYPGDLSKSFINTIFGNKLSKTNICRKGGKVVGLAHASFQRNRAWINALYVDREHRGKGVGEDLLFGLIRELKKEGVPLLFLGVDKSNSNAIKLYSNIGFEFTRFTKYQYIF